jgi:hypothetical protein
MLFTSASRPEQTFAQNLQASAPSILGGLCAAVSAALLNTATTEFTPVSRFADVHLWTAAAATALGLTKDQINIALAGSPLVDAIQDLLETRSEWTGSPTELFNTLRTRGMSALPASPRVLSEQLNSTALALFGITHEFFENQRRPPDSHVADPFPVCHGASRLTNNSYTMNRLHLCLHNTQKNALVRHTAIWWLDTLTQAARLLSYRRLAIGAWQDILSPICLTH